MEKRNKIEENTIMINISLFCFYLWRLAILTVKHTTANVLEVVLTQKIYRISEYSFGNRKNDYPI